MSGYFDHQYRVVAVLVAPEHWRWLASENELSSCLRPLFQGSPTDEFGVAEGRLAIRSKRTRTVHSWRQVSALLDSDLSEVIVESLTLTRGTAGDGEPPIVFCSFVDESALLVKKEQAQFSGALVLAVRSGFLVSEFEQTLELIRNRVPWVALLTAELPWGTPDAILRGNYTDVIRDMPLRGLFVDPDCRHSLPLSSNVISRIWRINIAE